MGIWTCDLSFVRYAGYRSRMARKIVRKGRGVAVRSDDGGRQIEVRRGDGTGPRGEVRIPWREAAAYLRSGRWEFCGITEEKGRAYARFKVKG